MIRIRVDYAKTSPLRYTSNLDVQKIWERMLRCAHLPLAYSQGFHPQPRLNLACPLPLGMTSKAEIIDIWLEKDLSIEEIARTLHQTTPPGIEIQRIKQVELNTTALQTQVSSAEYRVEILDPLPSTELDSRIQSLLSAEILPRERRDKSYNLRPLVETLERLPSDPEEKPILLMCLATRSGATGRPEEVLSALGINPFDTRIERTKLILKTNN